jgi:hypothetical protein
MGFSEKFRECSKLIIATWSMESNGISGIIYAIHLLINFTMV